MQRIARDESGAVAVIVAILSIVLFGMAALVIDVGQLYEERRELQNGADASALAIGWECVQEGVPSTNCPGDGTFAVLGATVTKYAADYAGANAKDGSATVIDTSEINIAAGWIQVDLKSDQPVQPFFAGLLGAGESTVRASAAVEVYAGGFSPIAFGTCELFYLLGATRDLGDPDVYLDPDGSSTTIQGLIGSNAEPLYNPDGTPYSKQKGVIAFQQGQPVNEDCTAPSGSDKTEEDAAGNFGWIVSEDSDCSVNFPYSEGLPGMLWFEGESGSANPKNKVGCYEEDLTGSTYLLVFEEVADVKHGDSLGTFCNADTGAITCYGASWVIEIDITGSKFPGNWDASSCSLLSANKGKGKENPDCIQGSVVRVLSLDAAKDATQYVHMILPPNS